MPLPLVQPASVDFSGIGDLPGQYMQAQNQAAELRALAERREQEQQQRAAIGALDLEQPLVGQLGPLVQTGAVGVGDAFNLKQQAAAQQQAEARRANIQRGLFGDGQKPGILAQSGLTQEDIQAFSLMDPEDALKAYQDARKGTDDIKEYNFARQQGFQGPFTQFMRDNKRAGAPQTSITNNMGAQNDLITQGFIEADINRATEVQGAAEQFRALMPQIDTVVAALESGVPTGRMQEMTLPIRQFAQELGFNEDPDLPQQEALAAAVAYMIPRMRVEGSGSTSDREMATFERAIPNLKNSEEGNMLIARGFQQVARRKQQEADFMRQYLRSNRNLDGVNKAIDNALGPLFVKPQSRSEYDAVPSGAVYIHPDRGLSVKQ